MDTEPNWSELPLELLTMIFEHLSLGDPSGNPTSDGQVREAFLHCREVNSTFKSVCDSVLEKKCLEFWSNWRPWEVGMITKPKNFPNLRLFEGSCHSKTEIRFLYNSVFESSPIPTKSVCFSPQQENDCWLFEDTRFLTTYGSRLTSLTLHSFFLSDPLPAKTLQRILYLTPNLKAITLQLVKITGSRRELKNTLLPSLPHLAHIRLWSVDELNLKFNLIDWILEFYKRQLVSFETDRGFTKGDNPYAFQSLKRLKIWNPSDEAVKQCLHFPALQSLSLGQIRVGGLPNLSLQQLMNFLWKHSKTLVNLHLDIARNSENVNCYSRVANLEIIPYSEWKDCVKKNTTVFPHMKTLSIFCPRYAAEVAVLKEMLKMFPNLETLKLIRFGQNLQEITEEDRAEVREHLASEQYWDVCKYLKNIAVYMDAREGGGLIVLLQHDTTNCTCGHPNC